MKKFIQSLILAVLGVATVRPASALTYHLTNDTPQGVNALLYESNGVANFVFTAPVNMGGSAAIFLTNNVFTNGIAIQGTNNNSLSTLVRLTAFGAIPTGGCNVSRVLSNEFTWWTLPFGNTTAPGNPTNGFAYTTNSPGLRTTNPFTWSSTPPVGQNLKVLLVFGDTSGFNGTYVLSPEINIIRDENPYTFSPVWTNTLTTNVIAYDLDAQDDGANPEWEFVAIPTNIEIHSTAAIPTIVYTNTAPLDNSPPGAGWNSANGPQHLWITP